jgi:predicted transcriptional regulator
MEVQLSPEQETELARMAAESGRGVDEFLRDLVERYLAEEARFHAGVRAGQEAAARGDFVETSEVWASVERVLKA